ncbi:MAG: tRNA (adenosine(37)-N6)-threonylcarbamoyltransferase complex ATPase subunit type 1 TsaE [Clostridia bacterium]|nr:tRNA (adenosine(37)-N6)-threonylcarbamoyltransferase complex ATPase subunit type 1 TsaE [Clostridia bacterium]
MLFIAHSPADTEKIAADFKKELKMGDIVCLHGDIGVGKTVFTRGLSGSDAVCSPTFSIMNIYKGTPPVYHFDLYRLSTEDELYEAGLMEYIESGDGISIIEWPDILPRDLDADIYHVYITKKLENHDNYREIEVKKHENPCD